MNSVIINTILILLITILIMNSIEIIYQFEADIKFHVSNFNMSLVIYPFIWKIKSNHIFKIFHLKFSIYFWALTTSNLHHEVLLK